MSFTVVPLHNINLPVGTIVKFGGDFVFTELPEWVKSEHYLRDLSYTDQQSVKFAKHALVAEYEAIALDQPDLASIQTGKPESIHGQKLYSAQLANLAMWLARPSTTCFTVWFHVITSESEDVNNGEFLINRPERQGPIYCHPDDIDAKPSVADIQKAAELHAALLTVPVNSSVWMAMRSVWAGLTIYAPDLRYALFWLALEALFGAESGSGEIIYKLSQRIAFFISDTPEDARKAFKRARNCYQPRSQIVHGRWRDYTDKFQEAMRNIELMLRSVFTRLLENPQMMKMFCSKHRDSFLEDWVFSRNVDPPPYAESV